MYLAVGPLKLFVLCIEIFCTDFGCHLKIQNEWTINNIRKWAKKLGDKKKSEAEVIIPVKCSFKVLIEYKKSLD